MTFGIGGDAVMPDEYLEALPLVTNWVVPGLVLMIGFGIGSLVTAYGVVRRPSWRLLSGLERITGYHWSWSATLLIGIGHVVWIMLELVSIPFSILMPVYGAVGLALALLPLTPGARRDLRIEPGSPATS